MGDPNVFQLEAEGPSHSAKRRDDAANGNSLPQKQAKQPTRIISLGSPDAARRAR